MSNKVLKSSGLSYDMLVIIPVVLLLCLGLTMVASASLLIGAKQFSDPFHYLFRQVMHIGVGLVISCIIMRIPVALIEKSTPFVLLLSLLALSLIYIPGLGRQVNGSLRWLRLGAISIQPAEFIKVAFILHLSKFISVNQHDMRQTVFKAVKPLVLLFIIIWLLLMQPDFGSVMVLVSVTCFLLFIGGAPFKPFVLMAVIGVIILGVIAVSAPYRLARLSSFLNPWQNPYGSGYQLTQALMAFGRGGLFGVGLGNSVQKQFYLPEAHTDFLFAILCEELGLVGGVLVIIAFMFLLIRMYYLGYQAKKYQCNFPAYCCFGLGFWLALQFMINIGVNTGLLPTKGLTLPFMSYGGSSISLNCICIAIILRISHELKLVVRPLPVDKKKKPIKQKQTKSVICLR